MSFLGDGDTNTLKERVLIFLKLLPYGICVNLKTGKLLYISHRRPKCVCKSLQLMRHGRTLAVERGEFMNDDSDNSRLTETGVKEIEELAKRITNILPDIILVGPLHRTLKTYEVLSNQLSNKPLVKVCEHLIGINNSVWGEKTFEMLDMENLYVFLQRECSHNIFAKTKEGDSWGDVLVRCARLLKDINKHYEDKKILLISQGSIYQGLKIILHQEKKPWDGYTASSMFGTINRNAKKLGYGRIFDIC